MTSPDTTVWHIVCRAPNPDQSDSAEPTVEVGFVKLEGATLADARERAAAVVAAHHDIVSRGLAGGADIVWVQLFEYPADPELSPVDWTNLVDLFPVDGVLP